jgi:hypothetical protein
VRCYMSKCDVELCRQGSGSSKRVSCQRPGGP